MRVVTNKRASTVPCGPDEVVVVICDSARCWYQEALGTVRALRCHLFRRGEGERDGKVNALYQTMVPSIKHGRIILVSADFSNWRHCFDPRATSVFRHYFPRWGCYMQL